MQSDRHRKLDRILKFQQRQLEAIELSIANKRRQLNQLSVDRQRLKRHLEVAFSSSGTTGLVVLQRQSHTRWMVQMQRQLNVNREQLSRTSEELDNALQNYYRQRARVKSWEKLLGQQLQLIRSSRTKQELRNADDRFLRKLIIKEQD